MISPGRASRFAPRRARTPPKFFSTPTSWRIGDGLIARRPRRCSRHAGSDGREIAGNRGKSRGWCGPARRAGAEAVRPWKPRGNRGPPIARSLAGVTRGFLDKYAGAGAALRTAVVLRARTPRGRGVANKNEQSACYLVTRYVLCRSAALSSLVRDVRRYRSRWDGDRPSWAAH